VEGVEEAVSFKIVVFVSKEVSGFDGRRDGLLKYGVKLLKTHSK
jgi:hypothetical protein